HGQGDLAPVSQHAELGVFRFAVGQQLFAQFAGVVDALAVQAGDDIANFQSSFRRGGVREYAAHQDALAIGRAEVMPEISFQVFRVNAQQGASWSNHQN